MFNFPFCSETTHGPVPGAERKRRADQRGTVAARCLRYLLSCVGACFAASAFAGPVILYSDLESSPVGAYVTVWGKGLGTARGSIKVGSTATQSGEILSWTDHRIEFRVPATAGSGISVHDTAGQVSNVLPFITRAGRALYVSDATGSDSNNGLADSPQGGGVGPWKTLIPAVTATNPGDVIYLRAGTYATIMNSGHSAFVYVLPQDSGSPGMPKALVAFPGESPVVGSAASSQSIFIQSQGVHDWTFAKLILKGTDYAIHMGGGDGVRLRFVANEASGFNSFYGTVDVGGCTDCKWLGNHIHHSGRSGNKYAHLFYYGGWGVGANVELGWNHLHDQPGGRCIQFYGHTDRDRLSGLSIHDNLVYNCAYDGILVGKTDAAYKPWISDAEVYNNVVYNPNGTAYSGGIRIDNPGVDVRILNNTFVRNRYSIRLDSTKSAEVRNNISSDPQDGHLLLSIDGDPVGPLAMDHNGFNGTVPIPSRDTLPIVADPLFTNPAASDYSLRSGSPMIGAGVEIHSPAPWLDNTAAPDLGAIKYGTSWPTPSATVPSVVITNPVAPITNPVAPIVEANSVITIKATATDDVAVTRVRFYLDGERLCTDRAAPYRCRLRIPDPDQTSEYEIKARAYDDAGNRGTHRIYVEVDPSPSENDSEPDSGDR